MNACCKDLPNDVQEQLNILDMSKFYVLLVIIGTCIAFHNLDLQKEQVVCSALTQEECRCKALFPLQMTSSTLILIAVIFFYRLSAQTVEEAACADSSSSLNFIASALTLGAVLIRFINLIGECK